MECVFESLSHTILAFAITCTHDGHAAVLEDCTYVAEVQVDDAVHRDDFSDASCGDGEGIVGFLESRKYVEIGIDFAQTLVVDNEEGIYVLGNFLHAVEGLVYLTIAFKEEGDGDDADGQDAHILCFACNDGCSARTCSATHTSGNKDHLRTVVEHFADVFHTFFGGFAGAFGPIARAKAFFAQLEAYGNGGIHQGFRVGVAKYEVDFVNAFAIHVVHSVTAATAHADDLNDGRLRARHVHVYE